ncbi:MAG: tetratricopeptide repeat protein [Paludibacteraceae bacterium]
MTPTEIHSTYKKILSYLTEGRIKNAFEKTAELNNELQSPAYQQTIDNLQTSYQYMLQYFMEGADDPERNAIYNKLIARIFTLASDMRDELLTRDSNNFEFTQKRYFPFTPQISNENLKDWINRKEKIAGWREINPNDTQREKQIETEFEQEIHYLFNYFWLKSAYDSVEVMDVYNRVMSDEFGDSVAKSMIVSGITLNVWRTFSENKLLMLLDACNSEDMPARQRALVGLCFILAKYNRFLPYFPSVRNRLVLLTDKDSLIENLQNIIIQIIGTTETDQISKKLQEEIFPELMKLRPMIDKGMDPGNPPGMDEFGEINPEWQEIIENSGASEKIQEFADLEMSGADVYMSTFSMLKSFPFFQNFSNWFIPFDSENNAVKPLFENDEKSLISAFVSSNVMCNSDRYSFCLSILQMPDVQRNLMKQSFSQAAEQMEEMNKDKAMIEPAVMEKIISKHYVQDLFRFFKLNTYRADFADMFQTALLMHKTYLFDMLSVDDEIKKNIAEYYFSKKLYFQALELYNEIEKEGETTAEIYQKMGYAYQQTSQLIQALNAYKKADIIQPDDFWTNRKMALCYRLLGDNENALKIYKHAGFIKPGNLSVHLQIVSCLTELKRYDEALKELTQLNKEYPDNQKVIRTTMQVAFTGKNMAQASYFASILLDTEDIIAYDYLIAGHISWCMNKNKEAKTRYNQTLRLLNNDWDQFVEIFRQDTDLLLENGFDKTDIPLILDAIKYDS